MNKENMFADHNGIQTLVDTLDYSETKVNIKTKSLNLYEYAHGALYFTLADCAAGIASRSNGLSYVTLNASINYMIAVKTGYLIAKASVISRSKKIAVVDVNIYDDQDRCVNKGTFIMYCVAQ